jgi:trimethylamine--corrinoid protein Co-methyltransferase
VLHNYTELLTADEVVEIHGTSMHILEEVGVLFPHPQALATFARHGCRIDGKRVYLSERQVMDAVAMAPVQFTLHARDPAKNVVFGDGVPVLAPASGAPFVKEPGGGVRRPSLADCQNLARLVHLLPEMHLTGHVIVMPADIPTDRAYLHVLHACMVHSDKPFAGGVGNEIEAIHSMEMASILFAEEIGDRAVVLGGVNSLTPLGYSHEMLGAMLIYAERGQPLMIGSAAMAGGTAPITLAGELAVQNAELLAGVVLTQLVRPGTPIAYASASGNMDMQTAGLSVGSPEFSMLTAAHAQLARFYGLPCKCGGALTDAHVPDFQAGFESMFGLLTALNCGADYVVHAAGILSSFRSFSYEKFVLDAEMCSMLLRYQQGFEVVPDTLAYDVIAKVGPGGNYLTEIHTVRRCRSEFWKPSVLRRESLETWLAAGQRGAEERAGSRWRDLLAGHQDPPLDKLVVRQLQRFMETHGAQAPKL